MITISRNQNFKEWLNVSLFGKVVDNAKRSAQALRIASEIQEKHKQKHGVKLPICSR
jgi:hypothetical protein|tara:strand:- start:448 stop:618 length:171 start_codon:yes stop_codon:yes gene_type:complete